MPNPSGVNNFDHFAQEPAYGEVSNQQRLQSGAPLAGQQITSGPMNAPRRAQRNAKTQNQQTQALPPAGAETSPQAVVALFWRQAAMLPGASDLVKEIAASVQPV